MSLMVILYEHIFIRSFVFDSLLVFI